MVEQISQMFGALISLGTVTVVLTSKETANVIMSVFSGFSEALGQAMKRS